MKAKSTLIITKFDINPVGLIIYFILRRLLFEEKQHPGDCMLTGRFAKNSISQTSLVKSTFQEENYE